MAFSVCAFFYTTPNFPDSRQRVTGEMFNHVIEHLRLKRGAGATVRNRLLVMRNMHTRRDNADFTKLHVQRSCTRAEQFLQD